MPTLKHEKSGRTVTVPTGSVAYYEDKGWSVAGAAKPSEPKTAEVVIPDGDPSAEWKVDQLKAYAERESIDLGDATKKDDIVAAIGAAKPSEPSTGE